MSDTENKQRSEADIQLEREVREGRKFTLAEAIGRLAGPGAMKGESPIPRLQQAEVAIASWLHSHHCGGPLAVVVHRNVKESEQLLRNQDQPLVVLAAYCQQTLHSDYLLKELVRSVDVEWGRDMGERPYFENANSPHPDDPYTIESVRKSLSELLTQLDAESG